MGVLCSECTVQWVYCAVGVKSEGGYCVHGACIFIMDCHIFRVQRELEELETRPPSSTAHPPPHRMTSDLTELPEEGEEGLVTLQEEVDAFQERFDRAVIEKHSLKQSCQQLSERLKTSNHLLERLVAIVSNIIWYRGSNNF